MMSVVIGSNHVGRNVDVSESAFVREVLPHFCLQRSVETFYHARFDIFVLTDVELHAFIFQLFSAGKRWRIFRPCQFAV